MKTNLVALTSGLLFGVGLVLGGMTRPEKVLSFLNLREDWDPSLGFVLAGALGTHWLAYRLVPRMRSPWQSERWSLPTRRDIDLRLLLGAVLFGAGWGLGGYCPGPAITALVSGATPTLIFVGAMLVGMLLERALDRWLASRASS